MDSVHHTKLTARERDRIALLRGGGKSIRYIARELGRSSSTICAEIKRNSFKGKYYVSIHAQARADKRKKEAGRRHPLKDPKTYSHVIEKLGLGWRPGVISGRLKKSAG